MQPLIILTGPTAVGKTALSIKLAQSVGGEIISADSMQVYRNMDIGTAKIKEEERQGIPHHLIDVLEPTDEFNVVIFQRMAKDCIREITNRGKIPIVTGGTGFYIQALLYDINFQYEDETADNDHEYRWELGKLAEEKGTEYLHSLLRDVDADAAEAIHPNNLKRIIRALEYFKQTGKPISGHNEAERKRESPYNFTYFVLNDNREKIYANINRRVDEMIRAGLVSEVSRLRDMGLTRDLVSMQGLGYKEVFAYLEGESTLDEVIRLIKRDTRRFAKRQLTWFGRERDVIWLNKEEYEGDDVLLDDMLRVYGRKCFSQVH